MSVKNSSPVGEACWPILRMGLDWVSPSMPAERMNVSTGRCRGSSTVPSSSFAYTTMVSAYGPLVIHVFEPLSTYSSPSRRAVVRMPPSASDPLSGSVIAQAPTLSSVSRSSPKRSICSGVPSFMIVPPARPVETPSDVTSPGLTLHS